MLNIYIIWPNILRLGLHQKERKLYIFSNICKLMFSITLFAVAPKWRKKTIRLMDNKIATK
jgi:hypothetical protein